MAGAYAPRSGGDGNQGQGIYQQASGNQQWRGGDPSSQPMMSGYESGQQRQWQPHYANAPPPPPSYGGGYDSGWGQQQQGRAHRYM